MEFIFTHLIYVRTHRHSGVHQYNRLTTRTVEEHWTPKSDEGDLDPLKVVRDIPQLFVALSVAEIQETNPQPRSLSEFLGSTDHATERKKRTQTRRRQGKKKAAEELGLAQQHHQADHKRNKNQRNSAKVRDALKEKQNKAGEANGGTKDVPALADKSKAEPLSPKTEAS